MLNVSQYISWLLEDRKLASTELAVRLGYKSQTSIARIMQGTANRESIEKFALLLMADRHIALNEHEKCELQKAVDSTLLGPEGYRASQEMWAFLCRNVYDSVEDVILENVEGGAGQTLSDRYAGVGDVRVMLLNCQNVPVFSSLKSLMKQTDAHIEHYLYVDADAARTIRAVSNLLTVFYDKRYEGFVYGLEDTLQGAMAADMMIVMYADSDGNRCEDIIVFVDHTRGRLMTRKGSHNLFLNLLDIPHSRFSPIKRSYFKCSAFEDYVQFSSDYTSLEINRAVYKIKPDIGIDYVSVDILEAAMLEGSIPKDEQFFKTLDELRTIYDQRNRNAFSKRKPSHTIMKKQAMWSFAKTGMTSDHFWGMRPFTVTERIRILQGILEQQRKNPYFHLYFLRNDDTIRDAEITCYDNIGILILDSNTDYNLSEGYSEAMITHSEFMRLFKDFIMQQITKRQVLTPKETTDILENQLRYCMELGK